MRRAWAACQLGMAVWYRSQVPYLRIFGALSSIRKLAGGMFMLLFSYSGIGLLGLGGSVAGMGMRLEPWKSVRVIFSRLNQLDLPASAQQPP
jgi:hypothetical protein